MFIRIYIHFFLNLHPGDFCVCVYICMYAKLYMYSCACSLSSNPIDLFTVITCECWQDPDSRKTALLWASYNGHADTVRVLVELSASLEAVDKVHIHAHALAYTCCIKHMSGMMRMTMIFFPPSPKRDHLICSFPKQFYSGSIKALF